MQYYYMKNLKRRTYLVIHDFISYNFVLSKDYGNYLDCSDIMLTQWTNLKSISEGTYSPVQNIRLHVSLQNNF